MPVQSKSLSSFLSPALLPCALLAATLLAACSNAPDNAGNAGGQQAQNTAQQAGMGMGAGGAMGGGEMGGGEMGAMAMGANAMGAGAGMSPPPDESSDLIPSAKLTYKTVEGKDLELHIFNPAGHKADDKRAALIFYHGGGFRGGTPESGYDLSHGLNAKGVVLISAQYRVTDTEGRTFDQILSDAKSSVRYVRAHADELGVDPNKIVSSGHSAGAYLGAANGIIDGFDQAGEDLSVSSMSNAMILWSMAPQRSEQNTGHMIGAGSTLHDYQLRTFLDSDLPPSLFIHGDQDQLLAPLPTYALMEEVRAAGNQTDFAMIAGADHFFRDEGHRDEAKAAIIEFLESIGFTQ